MARKKQTFQCHLICKKKFISKQYLNKHVGDKLCEKTKKTSLEKKEAEQIRKKRWYAEQKSKSNNESELNDHINKYKKLEADYNKL